MKIFNLRRNSKTCHMKKYAGKAWEYVLKKDRGYLFWALSNCPEQLPGWVIEDLTRPPEIPEKVFSLLKDDQIKIEALREEDKYNPLVIGLPGAGKSFLIKAYKNNVTPIAPTGNAAKNIDGVTIHSKFGINFNDPRIVISAYNIWQSLFIFDEIFYTPAALMFRVLSKILEVAPDSNFMFFGDPMQLKPVYTKLKENSMLVEEFDEEERLTIEELAEWKDKNIMDVLDKLEIPYKSVFLNTSVRHSDAETFEIMKASRLGQLTKDHLKVLNKQVTKTDKAPKGSTILTFRKSIVGRLNDEYIDTFKKIVTLEDIPHCRFEKTIKLTQNHIDLEESEMFRTVLTNKFKKVLKSMDPKSKKKKLRLSVGCRVIITKGISFKKDGGVFDPDDTQEESYFDEDQEEGILPKGIVNGDTGTVIAIKEDEILVDVIGYGPATIVRMFDGYASRGKKFVIGHLKFPVQPAAALTIHKSQGMTLKGDVHILIDPFHMTRMDGLLYTAFTRVQHHSQLSFNVPLKNAYFCFDKKWAATLKKFNSI